MLFDDAARIFVAHNEPPLAFSKKAKGFVPNPVGNEYFNTVELTQ
jgi:hypothetical protein